MIFDILEAKIASAGLGILGQSVFRSFMPDDCTQGVMFRVPLTGITVDPFIEGWVNSRLQMIVRHTDPVLGRIYCDELTRILVVERPENHPQNSERNEVTLSIFYPETEPIQFPRLDGNGIEWSQHFRMAYGSKPTWRV